MFYLATTNILNKNIRLILFFVILASSTASAQDGIGRMKLILQDEHGKQLAIFTQISGLGMKDGQVIENKATAPDGSPVIIKQGNHITPQSLTGKYTAIADDPILKWRQEVVNGQMAQARRNLSLIMKDSEGKQMGRWNFKNAWPTKFVSGNLSGRSNEAAVNTVTIEYERVEVVN